MSVSLKITDGDNLLATIDKAGDKVVLVQTSESYSDDSKFRTYACSKLSIVKKIIARRLQPLGRFGMRLISGKFVVEEWSFANQPYNMYCRSDAEVADERLFRDADNAKERNRTIDDAFEMFDGLECFTVSKSP